MRASTVSMVVIPILAVLFGYAYQRFDTQIASMVLKVEAWDRRWSAKLSWREIDADGTRYHYLAREPDVPAGSESLPLLIVPGLGMTAEESLAIVSRWKIPADKRVYLLEMPGCGYNNRAHDSRFRGTNLAEAGNFILAMVRALQLDRFDVYGYGYGAGILLHYFSLKQEAKSIRRALFINPLTFETVTDAFRNDWCQGSTCESPLFGWYDEHGYLETQRWRSVARPWLSAFTRLAVTRRRTNAHRRYWEQIARHVFYSQMPLNPRRLKRHAAPDLSALFLFGDKNQIVDPKAGRHLDALLDWERKPVEIVPNAGHFGVEGSWFRLRQETILDATAKRAQEFLFAEEGADSETADT